MPFFGGTKGDAEAELRRMMDDIDAMERGEVRTKPTTAQEALNIYKQNLEVRAKDKDYQYGHNVRSNCKVLQEFVDRFGPSRLIRECTGPDLREFYQMLCFRHRVVNTVAEHEQQNVADLRSTSSIEFEKCITSSWVSIIHDLTRVHIPRSKYLLLPQTVH